MYPFRIIIKDPELDNILQRLSHDRTVTIRGNKDILRTLGHKVKPIRQDIFIGFDFKTYDSCVSLKNPLLKLEKDKNYNWLFKI